ncbi:hypothetical protein L6R52_33460 [Myxococcota bacterium]|nr:hypothetical protein [Myxococcota bacterium]
MSVKTRTVGTRIIGDARRAFEEAAGSNQIISKREAEKLPKDLSAAVSTVRRTKTRVSVDDAVDAYARKVSYVLSTVDSSSRGTLSQAEAKKIRDPALRQRVLDVRAELAASGGSGAGGAGGAGSTADAIAQLAGPIGAFDVYHESGDHGVDVRATALAGARSLTAAMAALPGAALQPQRGADAIAAWIAHAQQALEAAADREGQDPAEIPPALDQLQAALGALTNARLATDAASGAAYLLGKARDGYVSVMVQDYSE